MFRATLILSFAALAACAPRFMPELNEEWAKFKETHEKQYAGEREEDSRRLIWEGNVRTIRQHNREADRGIHTYWMGVNKYADMTGEEFVATMNGYQMPKNKTAGNPVFLPPNNIAVADEVDWRTKGYVTGVKDQGQCGSCWSFSTTGSLEGQHFRKTGKLVSLSEQNLVDCSGPEGNHGCMGGLMDNAFRYIKMNKGIDTEESYPYTAMNGKCHFKPENVGATDTGYTDIKTGSEEQLKSAVASVGPVSVAIDASRPSFQLYKSGVYSDTTCSSVQLDHGVLAVGYGTENGQDYWLVKNSWGASWGDHGYLKMARNKHNMCGIATAASYPLV